MDGRLFKDELLYCEGKHKPWFRGKIHLASLVFLPVAVYYISFSNSPWVYFNLFGNVLCFGVSGLYHTFDWSPSTELFLQKLDHQAISIWTVTMMMPIAFHLFTSETRTTFLTILFSTFIANSYAIWTSQPSTILASSIPGSLILFWGECWKHMDSMEWRCMLLVFAFQSSGTVAYVLSNKGYRLCGNDTIFGYHELFHTATLFSAYFVYMVNYTIAVREPRFP